MPVRYSRAGRHSRDPKMVDAQAKEPRPGDSAPIATALFSPPGSSCVAGTERRRLIRPEEKT
jgi:hypothetical protein